MLKSKFIKSPVDCPHILVQGDNQAVLEEMQKNYKQSIDCIYIDPPYNNGEEYEYYSDSVAHDKWIKEMRQTLLLLSNLLKEGGSIWISIDDAELHYLKVLCDEVFGRSGFVANIVWQQRNTRENRKIFSNNHEYILVYSKNPLAFKKKRNLLPITEEILSRYSNPDNDPRGPWQSITANVQDGHAVASQFYEIVAPNGKRHNPPKGRCWVYNEQKMNEEIAKNNIWFGKDGNGVPRIKKFIANSVQGVVPETLWTSDFAGTNKDAKMHLQKLEIYDKTLFETPKPEKLIGRILEIATNEKDIVLDCFLGSGTTIATAHKMGRNYIGIEKNPNTCSHIKQRMEKVVDGEKGGISKSCSWIGGGTFELIKW
ncbi:MAG: site-specific DNA-methyltransferase [Eubacterium sp.]